MGRHYFFFGGGESDFFKKRSHPGIAPWGSVVHLSCSVPPVFPFFGGCPTKKWSSAKRVPFFSRVTEQLRHSWKLLELKPLSKSWEGTGNRGDDHPTNRSADRKMEVSLILRGWRWVSGRGGHVAVVVKTVQGEWLG